MDRSAGILMPISSLPSPYGIGTFGKAAYRFADFLHEAGQKYWQLLPLGPTSYGDSPYQAFSTFAGNPYFIDLDTLIADDLLTQTEVDACAWGTEPRYVDYGKIYESRFALLEKAKDALANSYMDKIEQGFRSYTQQLFPRQLGSVMVDKDLQPHIDVRGAAREVESFSAGLADSILLCMRLALVDALFGEETPFLILDDPFVNLDDEHTRRALAMLQEMAETHQILYLVCNTGRV